MSAPEAGDGTENERELRDAERMKFFTDAVVAIAMTLLILPLLESVAEVKGEGISTADFLHEHADQLVSFVISFAVIAIFWTSHERVFGGVGFWSGPLMALNIAWMMTIVFLPIAAALSGTMETDALQQVVYIGDMLASSLLMTGMTLVVHADRRIWEPGSRGPGVGGITASAATTTLFALALVLSLVFPALSYYALFVLFLTGPLQAVLERAVTRRAGRG